jgi:hypothetical protein
MLQPQNPSRLRVRLQRRRLLPSPQLLLKNRRLSLLQRQSPHLSLRPSLLPSSLRLSL